MPSREQRSPSVGILMNLFPFSSIFQAAFAESVAFPASLSRIATTDSLTFVPLIRHSPIDNGHLFECSGVFSTSRTTEFASSSMYSSPQIFQDVQYNLSEISIAPRFLSPKSLCLPSIRATLSLVIERPISDVGMSEPHRILLNPSIG